jgi:phytoene desaturase
MQSARPASGSGGDSIAVVGAGPGGLAAAMLLASRGLDVTIYEAQPRVGGRTMRLSATGQSGATYHFDRGPTFFLMPYVLEEIFAATGRRLTDYATLSRLDPMYRLVMGRQGREPITLDCTQELEEMMRRLDAIEPGDGAAFEEVLRENRRKLELFTPILRRPFRGALDCVNPTMLKALPSLTPHLSVAGYLAKRFKNHYVRLAMSFQSKYLGMSPYTCPSLFSILPFIEYEYGIWHPTGGCNALMTGMAEACAEMGVSIRCGEPVDQIAFEGTRATGVVVRGELHRHSQVVVNADASWAIKHLIPASLREGGLMSSARPYQDQRLDTMKYSCSTYMLYLGLKETLPLGHHTIYISETYEQNLADIAEGRITADPSVYFCNPTLTDGTLAPKGGSALYVLVPTANTRSGMNWETDGPKLREKALDRLAKLTGRDPRPLIDCEIRITPDDWRANQINFGATFNLAHGLDQMLHLRPRHELPFCQGVWLVGGGTHPGSGLPVIFLSSQITSRLICERLGLGDPMQPVPGGGSRVSTAAWAAS